MLPSQLLCPHSRGGTWELDKAHISPSVLPDLLLFAFTLHKSCAYEYNYVVNFFLNRKPNHIIIFICTGFWFTFCKVNTNTSIIHNCMQVTLDTCRHTHLGYAWLCSVYNTLESSFNGVIYIRLVPVCPKIDKVNNHPKLMQLTPPFTSRNICV